MRAADAPSLEAQWHPKRPDSIREGEKHGHDSKRISTAVAPERRHFPVSGQRFCHRRRRGPDPARRGDVAAFWQIEPLGVHPESAQDRGTATRHITEDYRT